MRVVAAAVAMTACPFLLAGQGQLLLRYDPVRDAATHTVFQTVTRVTTAEGRVFETADLGSMRAIPLQLEEGGTVVHMAYDSVRARVRSGSGSWREFEVPGSDSVWFQANVSERLSVSATSSGTSIPALTGLLGILTGLPGLALPELPVRLGGGWMVDSEMPERVSSLVPKEIGEINSLSFLTRITLDSINQRAQDTLGFFSVSGFARPIAEVDERALLADGLTVSGELTGQLVWSKGWNGFVSGARRITLAITKSGSAGIPTIERIERNLTVHATTRFQVRP